MRRHVAAEQSSPLTVFAPADYLLDAPPIDRATAQKLLHQLLSEAGLRAYRLELDQSENDWRIVAINCAIDGGWKTFHVSVDRLTLQRALNNEQAHRALLVRLANALAPCDYQRIP